MVAGCSVHSGHSTDAHDHSFLLKVKILFMVTVIQITCDSASRGADLNVPEGNLAINNRSHKVGVTG